MAYQLRFDFDIPDIEIPILLKSFPLFIVIRGISFLIAKVYAGIIRYTGAEDALRIFATLISGSAAIFVLGLLKHELFGGAYFFPITILAIEFLISCLGLIAYRISIKKIYEEATKPNVKKGKTIVYGAGEAGLITKRTLDRDVSSKMQVLAFVDDDPKKKGKRVEGVPVIHSSNLSAYLQKNDIEQIILAIQNPKLQNKKKVIDIALAEGLEILNVPPVKKWIKGDLSFKQLKPIRIEDLLERKEIQLNSPKIREMLEGKRILVTGAAGSIGSGLTKEILQYNPAQLVLLDQAESPLYELGLTVKEMVHDCHIESVIGDVRNAERLNNVFTTFRPQIVFHSAAYKHVPLMEENPSEAVFTNVLGSKHMADISNEYNVESFILISTDKAVNPSNVMGASKRLAEMYCQSLNAHSSTKFITTRFGNVLGSNGSVIPIFKKQIENGGPVKITHKEINRFFMTIPEACQLVLEAASFGEGGEIYLFDMGQPVKILDLAKNMIRLSGLEPEKDIEIEFIGLRPGEKIYEELLANEENSLPTHHEKIVVGKVRSYPFEEIQKNIQALIALFQGQDNESIVQKMKELVPEFKSNNSPFEKFD